MSKTITTPAAQLYADAKAAYEANEQAITNIKGQREKLRRDESKARQALNEGKSSRAILDAITGNLAKADALTPAIESLEAERPRLVMAVNRADGQLWAEEIRALAPTGTPAEKNRVVESLADSFAQAVATARAELECINTEAARLATQAGQLSRAGALPAGVSFNSSMGPMIDGHAVGPFSTSNLGEQIGRELDRRHAEKVRSTALKAA